MKIFLILGGSQTTDDQSWRPFMETEQDSRLLEVIPSVWRAGPRGLLKGKQDFSQENNSKSVKI